MLNLSPILKSGIRILRPGECKMLMAAIPKPEYKVMFQALLYSGMRYVEAQRLKKNPQWFDGNFIKISFGEGHHKEKSRFKERWVRLNPVGKMAIQSYLMIDKGLPSNVTWRENLRRWAKDASINPQGLCAKCTRKVYESWLVFYYPEKLIQILQSQGHTEPIAMQHYLNLPFTAIDRIEMEEFVAGWID